MTDMNVQNYESSGIVSILGKRTRAEDDILQYELCEQEDQEEHEPNQDLDETAIKANGDLLRSHAIQRIQDNPKAYEGLPREELNHEIMEFDFEQDDAIEKWNSLMDNEYDIIGREHDIYLANGGITLEEAVFYRNNYITCDTLTVKLYD